MHRRGGPPQRVSQALPFDGTAAGALARARQIAGPPPPAPEPDRPPAAAPERGDPAPEPAPNSPADAGYLTEEQRAAAARAADLARSVQPPTGAPRHHDPKTCSSCPAQILWAQTLERDERGEWTRARTRDGRVKSMPVDYHPRPDGNVVLMHWTGTEGGIVCRVFKNAEEARRAYPSAPLRTSHFATCKNAPQHRKSRR